MGHGTPSWLGLVVLALLRLTVITESPIPDVEKTYLMILCSTLPISKAHLGGIQGAFVPIRLSTLISFLVLER
jgi:hypothetical protein